MAVVHYVIPDGLHRACRTRAAAEGVTLKALLVRALSNELERPYDPPGGRAADRAEPAERSV